jgi:acetylornithine deacetylase/succinyl-diaminopimelate desuccinylase-like protein
MHIFPGLFPARLFGAAGPVLLMGSFLLISSPCLAAQDSQLARALTRPEIQAGLRQIESHREETASFLQEIGGIISPSGQEHERAAAVARRMREVGLQEVRVTSSPNAIGVIPGTSDRVLVFVSTLDDLATVAEHQRAAASRPRIEGNRVVGPGTNTSLTSAALLAAAEALVQSGLKPRLTLVFAAVAQEETGLVGMYDLYAEYRDRAEGFVDVLGDGHTISYGAIGIHWWRVVASGPGGHTLSGGLPNVNQGIGRAVDRILSLPDAGRQDDTRTRVNISILESGRVFNHKPESGWFSLDIRSMDADVIETIQDQVRSILESVSAETGIDFEMEPFQLTPGGQIPGAESSRLVRSATAISRHLGYEPSLSNSGSSNMNVAIAGGTLAIGLGGSRGGDRGQPGEWADIDGMVRTAMHVFLLASVMAGESEESELVSALRSEMEAVFAETRGMVAHTMEVYRHAMDILEEEGGDPEVVAASALLHDIGIPRAREVYGSSAGSYQEMEGPPICREILSRHAFSTEKTEHVCGIVANHHTAHDPGIVSMVEFGILWDADWLVNFPGRHRDATTQEKEKAIEEIFRTNRGKLLARQLFLE